MCQLSRNASGQLVTDTDHFNNWEQLINKNHLTVWRKSIPNSYLYEYKGENNMQVKKSNCLLSYHCESPGKEG